MQQVLKTISAGNKKRIIFFHHAGGSANQYLNLLKPWQNHFEISVLDLPGRQFRIREDPIQNYSELKSLLFAQVTALPRMPTYIFGHSMGALLAFGLALDIESKASFEIIRIGLSGFRPPTVENLKSRQKLSHLPDQDLAQSLEQISPMPDIAKQNNEALKMFLQVTRADFKIIESYQPESKEQKMTSPTVVYGGMSDPEVPSKSLADWQHFVQDPIEVKLFSGGHFFIFDHFNQIVSEHTNTSVFPS